MKRSFAVAALIVCAGGFACNQKNVVHEPGPPTPPPPYPRATVMPIDAVLQANAKSEIKSALNSSDELLRAHALETLKDLHLPDADQAVVTALGDRSVLVRKAAALAAGELRVQAAASRLPDLLEADPTPGAGDSVAVEQDRMAGIFAMHRLGNTQYSHEFEKTAVDPRPHIRGETAFLLGLLDDKTAIPILADMLHRDQDGNVRLQAAEALWRLGDERGEDGLIEATVSQYASDQMLALLGLAQPRDARVLGHVEGLLASDYLEVGLVAARAAGMLGSDDGYGVVLKGAASVDPRQRSLAAMAFGDIHRSDSQPNLAKLLKDTDPDVRLAAAGSIVAIAEPPR